MSDQRDFDKAALRGEPSYVWRDGQQRRFQMILDAAGDRISGRVFENGCGVGMYVEHLLPVAGQVFGLEFDFERAVEARQRSDLILGGAGEALPFPADSFDLIISHEVIEHVQDDHQAIAEMVRTLVPGGRAIIFCPNRGYPFETHGIYWRGTYYFGNKPFVNYLPRFLRERLVPHVRAYTRKDLVNLFDGLPVKFIRQEILFGAYDNIIAKYPGFGRILRNFLQALERTPLRVFGLSHFWVVEKIE